MTMKKIKFLVLATVLFSTIAGISFYLVRSASYTIQTSGKLYIVNKLSKSITVFDLFQGKELTEFPMSVEPHEATTLKNLKKVVVTNYGAPDEIGKSSRETVESVVVTS